MKSYVKEFKYHDTPRKLFVMRETTVMSKDEDCNEKDIGAVDGIELTYLSDEEAQKVVEALKDHEVKNVFTKGEPIEGYDPAWGKAWRRYDKSKFQE